MQVTGNGRVRRTEAEWRDLISRWKTSGQGVVEFCREQRLHLTSFQRWRQRLAQVTDAPDFVTVLPAASAPELKETSWSLELVLPSGCTLRLRG